MHNRGFGLDALNMESTTLSKQEKHHIAEAAMALAHQDKAVQRAAAQFALPAPPICLGCGARNHPDDHGALPCGH